MVRASAGREGGGESVEVGGCGGTKIQVKFHKPEYIASFSAFPDVSQDIGLRAYCVSGFTAI